MDNARCLLMTTDMCEGDQKALQLRRELMREDVCGERGLGMVETNLMGGLTEHKERRCPAVKGGEAKPHARAPKDRPHTRDHQSLLTLNPTALSHKAFEGGRYLAVEGREANWPPREKVKAKCRVPEQNVGGSQPEAQVASSSVADEQCNKVAATEDEQRPLHLQLSLPPEAVESAPAATHVTLPETGAATHVDCNEDCNDGTQRLLAVAPLQATINPRQACTKSAMEQGEPLASGLVLHHGGGNRGGENGEVGWVHTRQRDGMRWKAAAHDAGETADRCELREEVDGPRQGVGLGVEGVGVGGVGGSDILVQALRAEVLACM